MPSNIERFGQTLHGQMKNVGSASSGSIVELGRINEKGELLPDESPGPIPEGEYSVCSGVTGLRGGKVLINWCGSEAVIVNTIWKQGGE